MTPQFSPDEERARALMMATLDGEATAEERRELDALLARSPALADEWRRFTRLKEVTTAMTLRHPPEEIWDRYWGSTYSRLERGVAWILLSLAALILGGFWLWHAVGAWLADSDMPWLLRAGVAAGAIGALVLVISVVREKLFTARRDPYQREVIR